MTATTGYTVSAAAVLVPRAEIVRGDNDREEFGDAELRELADSLALDGLKQPIVVRPVAGRLDGVRYELVAGERRFRASALLGWKTIPAFIETMDDAQAARVMFLENIKRKDLNPMEEARAYAKWQRKFGYTVADCAREGGKTEAHVEKMMSLNDLIEDVQRLIRAGTLTVKHAWCLAGLNEWSQSQALRFFNESPRVPTVADFRARCSELLEQQASNNMFDADIWLGQALAASDKKGRRRLPVDPSLPKMDMRKQNGHIGTCLANYAAELRAAGREAEALAITSVTQHLVDIGRLWLQDDMLD